MNLYRCTFLYVSCKRKLNGTIMKAFYSVYLLPSVLDIMRESVFELIYRKRDKCLRVRSCAAGLAARLVKSQVSLH